MAALPETRRRPLATILPLVIILAIVAAFVLTLVTMRPPSPPRRGALQVAPLEPGQLAPSFSLRNVQKDAPLNPVTLAHLLQNGPVVVIFNMGLHCSACAGEL